MTKYEATDSKGRVHTRGTKRTYTHAVIADWESGNVEVSWAGRPDLADARATTFRNWGAHHIEIVEAKEV